MKGRLKKLKLKLKITINWYGENREFFLWAKTRERGLSLAIHRLANQTEINPKTVRAKVLNGSDCYSIKEIKENE